MIRLSIVIPMFNVEPYVERCLRSLEDQDIPKSEYEIICINDGSPDDSRGVVIMLQKEFNNIRLIDQENKGVSRARNRGIDSANGKYLLFIDPDDFVDSNSFARILSNIDRLRAQVSFLGYTVLGENGSISRKIFNENLTSRVFIGTNAYFMARGDGKMDPDRMWAVLFRSDFLNANKLRYLPDVPFLEDGELIARILCLADSCIFDGLSFYQRTSRPGSATHSNLSRSDKSTTGFLLAANNLKKFQIEKELNDTQLEFLNQPILKFVLLAVNSCIGRRLFKKLAFVVKNLKASGFMRMNLAGCNPPYLFYGRVYNFSPYLSVLALFLYPRVVRFLDLIFRKKR